MYTQVVTHTLHRRIRGRGGGCGGEGGGEGRWGGGGGVWGGVWVEGGGAMGLCPYLCVLISLAGATVNQARTVAHNKTFKT